MSRSYRDFVAWQKGMQLSVKVYELTKTFPREELYGMTSQLRRASISVISNIAEGHGRGTKPQLVQFLFDSKRFGFRSRSTIASMSRIEFSRSGFDEPLSKFMRRSQPHAFRSSPKS